MPRAGLFPRATAPAWAATVMTPGPCGGALGGNGPKSPATIQGQPMTLLAAYIAGFTCGCAFIALALALGEAV